MIELNKESLDSALDGEQPLLVDFYADWCGPCKRLAPILERIEQDYIDRVVVAKVDIVQHPDIAKEFNVKSLPTLILCKTRRKPTALCCGMNSYIMKDFACKNLPLMLLK